MTELITPILPDYHPLSMYVSNLRAGTSISWFSETTKVVELRDYVWSLMDLSQRDLRHKREGFAETANETVLFVGAESPKGSILTCFPLDDVGLSLVNSAVADQWEIAMEEMRRGEHKGFPVHHHNAVIREGKVVVDSFHFAKGEEAIDIINGATIVPLADADESLDERELGVASEEKAGLDRSIIEMVLRNDPDVLNMERVDGADAFWRISVSFDDHPPAELFVNGELNKINVIVFVPIDWDHPGEALQVVGSYQVVGLAMLGEGLFIRSGIFIDHSTIHALTNCYRSVALAYWAYQEVIAAKIPA